MQPKASVAVLSVQPGERHLNTLEQRIRTSTAGQAALRALDEATETFVEAIVRVHGVQPTGYLRAVVRTQILETIAARLGIAVYEIAATARPPA